MPLQPEPLPIFDGHNDTLLKLGEVGLDGRAFLQGTASGHLDLPRAQAGGLMGGIFAIFAPTPKSSPESDPYFGFTLSENGYTQTLRSPVGHEYAKALTLGVIDLLDDLVLASDDRVGLIRESGELARNLAEGVFSIVLHLEGAAAIKEDLSDLQAYYERGVRSLGLVWSRPNVFGCGVPFRYPHSPDTGPGLTSAGKALVRRCNQMGILIDLAHINEKGFWDVARLTDAPLVVSHAGVHAICPSTRNLTDAQIDAIGRSNGLVGIIFEPVNTRPDGRLEQATSLDVIVDHIDYVAQRIGVDHVAFGSDFDGADMPLDLGDVTGLPRLTQALADRGYTRVSLEKIAYRNWFRVLRESWRA